MSTLTDAAETADNPKRQATATATQKVLRMYETRAASTLFIRVSCNGSNISFSELVSDACLGGGGRIRGEV